MTRRVRSPIHAGSWYDGDGAPLARSPRRPAAPALLGEAGGVDLMVRCLRSGHALSSSIEQWMEDVSPSGRHATAIIGPYAFVWYPSQCRKLNQRLGFS